MIAYSGHCEILCADGNYAPSSASLVEDDEGDWSGRLTCAAVDWFTVERRGEPVTIRFPSGSTAAAVVTRFTYLLRDQVQVKGAGPCPW
jgi:hypothetical protein